MFTVTNTFLSCATDVCFHNCLYIFLIPMSHNIYLNQIKKETQCESILNTKCTLSAFKHIHLCYQREATMFNSKVKWHLLQAAHTNWI